MADIRSAREIALEKVEKLEAPTEKERLTWKYGPDGEQIAARYLKEDESLVAALSKYDEAARKYVKAGAAKILIENIALPKNDFIKNMNRKAMEGLRSLKSDKTQMENIFTRIRQLFSHYSEQGEKQKQMAYQDIKTEFEARIRPEMEKQYGLMPGTKIDVEKLPQFQQEWRKAVNQMDSQYMTHLKNYKEALLALS
jgi:hypothetical protein